MTVRLTKNELRDQQIRLSQLEKYLPTLQLKKAMLQSEVNHVRNEIAEQELRKQEAKKVAEKAKGLIADTSECSPLQYVDVEHVQKRFENIAGVEIPIFEGVRFVEVDYPLLTTSAWVDSVVSQLRVVVEVREKIHVLEEKKRALEHELREVSIRVNLFEKVLIPRCTSTIKKIQLFLGEQQLVAVAQAKVAKAKILARKEL